MNTLDNESFHMEDFLLREASVEDAAQIIEYLNCIGGESDNLLFGANEFQMTIEAESAFIEELSVSKTSAMFIGMMKSEIVCIGTILTEKKKRIAHQADVALSVKKKYWGLGIGTKLMERLIDFATKNGVTEIVHLGVNVENARGISLYKKMGFEEVGIYKKFFKIEDTYYDALLMDLFLPQPNHRLQ